MYDSNEDGVEKSTERLRKEREAEWLVIEGFPTHTHTHSVDRKGRQKSTESEYNKFLHRQLTGN